MTYPGQEPRTLKWKDEKDYDDPDEAPQKPRWVAGVLVTRARYPDASMEPGKYPTVRVSLEQAKELVEYYQGCVNILNGTVTYVKG